MLKDLLTNSLEKVVNHYLRCDADYQHFLQPLVQKIICLEILKPSLTLHLEFTPDHIKFLPSCYIQPDCTIRGETLNLLKLAHQSETSMSANNVEIKGNIEIANAFAELCRNLSIDWEAMLAKVVGDGLAYAAGSTLRNVALQSSQCKTKLQLDLDEYLHHEARIFPTRCEIDNFLDKVDTLRHDVDRLSAKFLALKDNLG